MSYLKNDNFFCPQGWMVNVFKLKGQELIVFSIIFGFSQTKDNRFTAPLKYLQEWTFLSKPALIEILKKLVDINLVLKYEYTENHVKRCEYAANCDYIYNILENNIEPIKTGSGTVKETLTPRLKNFNGTVKETLTDRLRNFNDIYNIINNKNKIIKNTESEIPETSKVEDIFNKTLKDKQKEIKETKKIIKNKVQEKLLENNTISLDDVTTEKMSDLHTEEIQQNRAAAAERAASKEATAKQKLLQNTKKARIKEATKLFPEQDILDLLGKYLDMYQVTYNMMSAVSWQNILDDMVQYTDNIEKLKFYIKESTTKAYRKIYPVDTKNKDNTIFHKTDEKALHELTEEEKEQFEETLAKDESGNFITF